MIRFLHCSRVIEKQLKSMRKAGKKGELAALQGERIIEHLKNERPQSKVLHCKRTKYGEYRINNCVKYDLGNGYRLVTIRVAEHLFITFAGSHDKTDQWIERHRHDIFQVDDRLYISEELRFKENDQNFRPGNNEKRIKTEEHDPYEEKLQARIDESLLKSIFKGLLPRR